MSQHFCEDPVVKDGFQECVHRKRSWTIMYSLILIMNNVAASKSDIGKASGYFSKASSL